PRPARYSTNETVDDILTRYLYTPTPRRMFALALAMRNGISVSEIADITGIDPWFLERIQHIVDEEQALQADHDLFAPRLLALKQLGISDKRIGKLTGKTGLEIRALRKKLGIIPSVFQIDTLAAEYPSDTNYLYITYNGQHHDAAPIGDEGVIVLGSGPYRIGSSVEFDWTSVSTVEALKKHHKRSIVINCNPETVSTDYDISDRLYFEELTFERIADICEFESPYGVIVSVGGQTPNNRVKALHNYGVHILGTSAAHIDQAEDRSKFSKLLDALDIRQPAWDTFVDIDRLTRFAERVGFPVLVRPSYVLSGNAMNVCYTREELEQYAHIAMAVSAEHPVTVSRFFQKVKEIELDAVAQHGEIKVFVISEHVENAGVHSGDATIVLPPQTLNNETRQKIEQAGRAIARALDITGPFNIQFLAKDNQVYVIEANLRASRTFPFISKVAGVNFIEIFVDALFAQHELEPIAIPPLTFTAVKAPQFSFSRLTGADPILRVEMASTGEVACFGEDLEEAYLKAIIATGGHIPEKGIFISLGGEDKKVRFLESARLLGRLGIPLYATEKTCAFLRAHDIEATMLYKIHENQSPNILTYFSENKLDLAINIVDNHVKKELDDDYLVRRYAVDHNIPLFTKIKQARLFVRAIVGKDLATVPIKSWNEYL
ncbi:MAG TPA: carbamoyl-phosphate synthase large subunit, partial [Ktedonobacteraceae bacterium]|nr:carbamoyl-phosphate synthase large subunit [Ktedonobacteraceae bacterium]